jgi:hypothetical protein
MSEKCPLDENRHYWFEDIPEFCISNCYDLWEEAEATTAASEDLIDRDCQHDLEHGGAALARGKGSERRWTLLSSCVEPGDDVLNETYTFTCPRE